MVGYDQVKAYPLCYVHTATNVVVTVIIPPPELVARLTKIKVW